MSIRTTIGVTAALLFSTSVHATEPEEGNAVTRGVEYALQAVRDNNISTPAAGRLYAMATVAMYDAVNGLDSVQGHGRAHALVAPGEDTPRDAHRGIAASAAAIFAITAVTPNPYTSTLLERLREEIERAGGEHRKPVERGLRWGTFVGTQVGLLRANDGTATPLTIAGSTEGGRFRPDWTNAQFKDMAPFGIVDPSAYRSAAPPALTSNDYSAAWHEVRLLGSREDTVPERDEIITFWQAEAGTARETGLWLQAALEIAKQEGTTRSLSQSARLFALLGMGTADAVRVSWEEKTEQLFWRPTEAIRFADLDGNPETVADPGWTSQIGSQGSSPEWTSGTSTFAGASARILAGFYCTDDIAFTFRTDLASKPRTYQRFSQAADEAGRSRIFQGIHFQFSNLAGRDAGRGVGEEIVTTRLLRAGHQPSITQHCPQF